MLKKILLIMLVGIGALSFASPYTAPTYNAVNFTLCSGYTAPTYNQINFTLGDSDACGTPPSDTCSCPGLNQDWEIDMSDHCIITSNCDLGTGTLSFTGSGNCTIDATIDTSDMGDPSSGGIIWMNDEGVINVS